MQELPKLHNFAELSDFDRSLIMLIKENPNISDSQLAKIFECTRKKIANHRNNEVVQAILKELDKSALEVLLESQSEAARLLKRQLKDSDPKIAQGAAKEILKGVLKEGVEVEGVEIVFVNATKKDKD